MEKRQRRYLAMGGFTLLLLVFISMPVFARPVIEWTPASVSEEVLAGDTVSIPVSFTASRELGMVEVRVVPELAEVVSVKPSGPFAVSRGETVDLELILAPNVKALPETLNGVIQIRAAGFPPKNVSRPISVSLEITRIFFNRETGVQLTLPSEITEINAHLPSIPLETGLGYTFLTFRRAIDDLQTPTSSPEEAPFSGCSYAVSVEDNSGELSLENWLMTRSYTRQTDVIDSIFVADRKALMVSGTGEIFGNAFVSVIVPQPSRIILFSLDMTSDGNSNAVCSSDLSALLSSFTFTQQ